MAEYKELANKRLKNAIKYLRMVKRMTASNAYKVEAEDVEKIIETLECEVEAIGSAFQSRSGNKAEIEDIF